MHLSAHAIAGASLGRKVRWPWLAFLIGIASHAVLDAAPQPKLESWSRTAEFLIFGLGLFLVLRLPKSERLNALLCAMGALLPDAEVPLTLLFPEIYSHAFYPTHTGQIRQWEAPAPWGPMIQSTVILVGLWIVWRAGKKHQPSTTAASRRRRSATRARIR